MSCSSIRKYLLGESSPTPPQINSLLKGGCNLSPVNVLGVESILPGFSNLKKKKEEEKKTNANVQASN